MRIILEHSSLVTHHVSPYHAIQGAPDEVALIVGELRNKADPASSAPSPHQPDCGPALAVIDLIEGYASDGAFSRKVLVDAEVDNTTLLKALIESLKPFGPFLSDGKGVALIMDKDGKASIVGVSMLADREGGAT